MVDDNLADTAAEKPLAQLADAERALDADSPAGGDPATAGPAPETAALDEPPALTAAQILRSFEDEHLGPDTPRYSGMVEHGMGSPLRNLSPELQREHAALEKSAMEEF